MKTVKERNPYLKRTFSQQPHKYSFDIQSGKFFLISQDGTQQPINKNGSFQPKFRKNFTGFISHKERYEAVKTDKAALHFTPDLAFKKQNAYYTPFTKKFLGYAQYPYKIKDRKDPIHLTNPDQDHTFKRTASTKQPKKKVQKRSDSVILENSAKTFIQKRVDDRYFEKSFSSITETKPLPKFQKKTCYNYKCKYLRQFTFDEKEKTQTSTRLMNTNQSWVDKTTGKSFYDNRLEQEKKEASMLSTRIF